MKVVTSGFIAKVFHRSGPNVNRPRYNKLAILAERRNYIYDC